MKVSSWNVNGLRSIGDIKSHLSRLDSDITCFQETKISRCQLGIFFRLRGLGGGGGSMTLARPKSSFLLFLTEGSVSYQMIFTRSKNIVPIRSYHILKF